LENGEVIIENIRFGAILRDRERILLYDTACRMSRDPGRENLLELNNFNAPTCEETSDNTRLILQAVS
jgi:hypothetical protein